MKSIFYELIRVSIGIQDNLSRIPSESEWGMLYKMAEMQSLVGVCFAAIQRLGANSDEGYARIGISKMQYFTWMGMAAKIQQRNERVNQQCGELQERLAADGLRSCILKGQGVASLYSEYLRELRQSGDIDVLVDCNRKDSLVYLRGIGMEDLAWDYVHIHPRFFYDTEVEWHYRVSVDRNLWTSYKLQKFFAREKEEFFCGKSNFIGCSLVVPSNWMNLFYLLQHAYRHIFSEGLGLRQVMDLYFAFKTLNLSNEETTRLQKAVRDFGMVKFVTGLMWVLSHVFGLSINEWCPWTPNKREGEFLLDDIMQSGNMGKMDSRFRNISGSRAGKLLVVIRRTLHLATHYPAEALSTPVYYAWHFIWKRIALLSDK